MKSVIVESVSVEAGGRVLGFKRRLNARPQSVWAALTEPEKLRQWYAVADDYPVQGQQYRLYFENSNTTVQTTVTRAQRPSVLEYTWDSQMPEQSPVSLIGSVVRFELEPHDDGTILTVNHIFRTDEAPVADVLGGWHIHLDDLSEKLHTGFDSGEGKSELSASFLARCGVQSAQFALALSVETNSQYVAYSHSNNGYEKVEKRSGGERAAGGTGGDSSGEQSATEPAAGGRGARASSVKR